MSGRIWLCAMAGAVGILSCTNSSPTDSTIPPPVSPSRGNIDDGLILHLPFDNNSYSDTSPLHNPVTWSVPAYAPGVHADQDPADTAASVSQSYIQVSPSNAYSGVNALTYSMWVKKTEPTAYEWMLEESGAFYLLLTSWGDVRAGVFSVDPAPTSQYYNDVISYNQGQNTVWNLYTVVYDGSQYLLYINGAKIAIKTCMPSNCLGVILYRPNDPIIIGGRRPNQYFNGVIDDVRIYNRSLSESEISQLYGTNES